MARSAAEIAELMRRQLADIDHVGFSDLFADDAVFEYPFGFPGSPERIQGREAIRDHLVESRRGAMSRIRITNIESAVHETSDPEVAVVEFTVSGTVVATGDSFSFASGLGVITARDGKVVRYRDYSNVAAAGRLLNQEVSAGQGENA